MDAPCILGGWRLLRWEVTYDDGRPPSYPYGADAQGRLLYTADGQMMAAVASTNRAPLSSASTRSAPETEKRAAFDSFFCYGGRYELREDHVIHHVEIALNPNFVGTDQVRFLRLENGTLTLSASDTVPGSAVARHHRLVWTRA